MTRLLVILIALLLAWMWISRMVRGVLRSPRAAEARSFLRLLQVLQRSAAGGRGRGTTGSAWSSGSGPRSASAGAGKGGPRGSGSPEQAGALLRCRRCGVHVPEAQLTGGVCGNCVAGGQAG